MIWVREGRQLVAGPFSTLDEARRARDEMGSPLRTETWGSVEMTLAARRELVEVTLLEGAPGWVYAWPESLPPTLGAGALGAF